LILKDGILVVLGLQTGNGYLKQKAGASSLTPNVVLYEGGVPENKRKSRKILDEIYLKNVQEK
jgi:hypothetical protein